MPVPKRKRSRSRRDKRFANKGLAVHTVGACPNCAMALRSHQACSGCGHYKGVKVMQAKTERAAKRNEVRKNVASRKAQAAKAAGSAPAGE